VQAYRSIRHRNVNSLLMERLCHVQYDLEGKFTLAALDTSEGTLQLKIGNKG